MSRIFVLRAFWLLLCANLACHPGMVAAGDAEPAPPKPETHDANLEAADDSAPATQPKLETRDGTVEAGDGAAPAPEGMPFPGPALTAHVQSVRTMAERAYESQLYSRAYRYFLKGLVWRGDKYAQYMVGYMLLHGQGVARDAVEACAWFRLAAERGNATLVAVHAETEAQLDAEQRDTAAAMYDELHSQYGDRVILSRLIRDDRRRLAAVTGSRTGNFESLPIWMYRPDGRAMSVRRYYSEIQRRIDTRMEYLRGIVELGEFRLIEDEHDARARQGVVLTDDLELVEDVAPAADENALSSSDER